MNARLLAALLWLACAPVLAHHSVTATYDTSRSLTFDATVREFELSTPHSRLSVEAKQDGKSMLWEVELPSIIFLHRAGWTDQSLMVGEHIHLTGAPSRFSASGLYATRVVKADGTELALLPSSALSVGSEK